MKIPVEILETIQGGNPGRIPKKFSEKSQKNCQEGIHGIHEAFRHSRSNFRKTKSNSSCRNIFQEEFQEKNSWEIPEGIAGKISEEISIQFQKLKEFQEKSQKVHQEKLRGNVLEKFQSEFWEKIQSWSRKNFRITFGENCRINMTNYWRIS